MCSEVDRAVAIEVMGWGPSLKDAPDGDAGYIGVLGPLSANGEEFTPSSYLNDSIRAAVRLRRLGLRAEMVIDEPLKWEPADAPYQWAVRVFDKTGAIVGAAVEPVLALAICRAALGAVREAKRLTEVAASSDSASGPGRLSELMASLDKNKADCKKLRDELKAKLSEALIRRATSGEQGEQSKPYQQPCLFSEVD